MQIIKWFISPLDATKQKLVSLPSIVVQVVVCAQSSLCWKNVESFMETSQNYFACISKQSLLPSLSPKKHLGRSLSMLLT